MEKRNKINPRELYLEILAYNLESLERLKRSNRTFYTFIESKIERWFEEFFSLPDSFDSVDLDYEDVRSEDPDQIKDIINSEVLDTYVPNEDIDKSEEMDRPVIDNLPLNKFNDFDSESLVKLNLFGIYTIQELTKSNILNVSACTGISKKELLKLKREIIRFGS